MDQRVVDAAIAAADQTGVPRNHKLACVEVESAGKPFALVNGRDEPLIRWEGHYFYRHLSGAPRDRAVALGLAHPTVGAVKNPSGQEERWERLLNPGIAIDRSAALSSCSWGLGQVMGANFSALGFRSVEELVETARSGVAGQIELMTRFIRANGILDELDRGDWAGFARVYNGPGYRANAYDTKMAAAAKRWKAALEAGNDGPFPTYPPPSKPLLRLGDEGEAVKELQARLNGRGFSLVVDGDFGPNTKGAVQEFQRVNGLVPDGIVGRLTWAALRTK